MNIVELKQEAYDFYEAVRPVLELDIEDMSSYMMWDISLVAIFCATADEKWAPEEILLLGYALSLVRGNEELVEYLDSWNSSDEIREGCFRFVSSTVDHVIEKENYNFIAPRILGSVDEKYDTDFYEIYSNALYKLAKATVCADDVTEEEELVGLSIVRQKLAYDYFEEEVEEVVEISNDIPADTLDSVSEEIEKQIGMANIKAEVSTLFNLLKLQKMRRERGIAVAPISLHSVFSGPPGTGKTTIARLIGKVYKQLGMLEKGHVVETDRAGLVGSYIGHTAEKVEEKIREAMGGVLFIDEAYTLKPEHSSNDFGQEAIDIILKRMEDHRDKIVVIVAGYPDEMERFLSSNPGLKSRFNRHFNFDHYTPCELVEIYQKFCFDNEFSLTENAKSVLTEQVELICKKRDKNFGNGREMRNLFERTLENQANRLASHVDLTDEMLTSIAPEDLPSLALSRS
jgi:ATPase family associated with various cellular activities (AAA)/AAA lid domain